MTPEQPPKASDGSPIEWWFNTKTGEVESGRLSAAPHRLGPFASASEAANALLVLAQRAAAIRREDEED